MKKILALVLCAVVMLSLAVPAAAEGDRYLRNYYTISGEDLCLYGAALTEDSSVTVTINGQTIDNVQLSTVAAENVPVTYFCLVDPSSSFSRNQKTQQEDALFAISNALRDEDAMVLAKMEAEGLSVGEILKDREARKAAIEEDWKPAYHTDIFTSMETALSLVADKSQYPGLVTVVLITDGIYDASGEATEETARDAVRKSGIGVNTIAVVAPFSDTYAFRCAVQALNLAEESVGGVALNPTGEGIEAREAGERIVKAVTDGAVIRVNTAGLDRNTDQQTIQVSVRTEDGTYQNTVVIPTAVLPAVAPPPEPEIIIRETEPETLPPVEETEEYSAIMDQFFYFALIGGSLITLLLVAAVVIFFVGKRREEERSAKKRSAKPVQNAPKKQPSKKNPGGMKPVPEKPAAKKVEEMTSEDYSEWAAPSKAAEPDSGLLMPRLEESEDVGFIPEFESFQSAVAVEAPAVFEVPGCSVKLVPTVDDAWQTEYFLPVNDGKTFGRSQRSDYVLNETDFGLSGVHFELMWDGRVLYLRDKNSTNGTALDRVPLMPDQWMRMENGMVILAGSYEYRVTVEKK